MSILWCGGQDVDFPNGSPCGGASGAPYCRTGWSLYGITSNTSANYSRSNNFAGGAVTSCWFTFRGYANFGAGVRSVGLSKDSSSNAGLYIGGSGSSGSAVAIYKFDGTTQTQLAAESGTSVISGQINRYDVQLVNYGATATINVYVNYTLVISYSGNPTVAGVTSLSAVTLSGWQPQLSELIVSDVDTRPLPGLLTLGLTGAGTTAAWTNPTYTNLNLMLYTDASPASSNTDSQAQDYNVTDMPSGIYNVLAVKITARMAKSATPAVNQVQLGYKNGSGSTGAGAGAIKAVGTAYGIYEQVDVLNPITGSAWAQSDMNAMQIELVAKT